MLSTLPSRLCLLSLTLIESYHQTFLSKNKGSGQIRQNNFSNYKVEIDTIYVSQSENTGILLDYFLTPTHLQRGHQILLNLSSNGSWIWLHYFVSTLDIARWIFPVFKKQANKQQKTSPLTFQLSNRISASLFSKCPQNVIYNHRLCYQPSNLSWTNDSHVPVCHSTKIVLTEVTFLMLNLIANFQS